MLTFFRKIRLLRLLADSPDKVRKNLLTPGIIKKYVFYAIGEIVLVVIGILIALQVNNWNERRKDIQKETEYLVRLKRDIELNLSECENQININQVQSQKAELILDAMVKDDLRTNSQSLFFALAQVSYYFPYSFVRGVWDELNSTGNIGIIRDVRLRDRLIELYRLIDFALDLEEEKQSYYLDFRETMRGVLDPYAVMEVQDHPLSYEGFDLETPLPGADYLVEILREIPKMNGIVADIILARKHGAQESNSLKEQITQILELIDENLGIGN